MPIFIFVTRRVTESVRQGVAGYRSGADGMAWEATAGNWRRRRAAALGFGGERESGAAG